MPAHKFLLALASPVFRRGFCGDFKEETAAVIDMLDTTLAAFKAMMGVLYKRPLDYQNMSVTDTMELVNLAERYHLMKLKSKLQQQLEVMVLAKEKVVECANTAMKFLLLEEASKALLKNCAKTLARELDTKDAVIEFFSSYSGTGEEVIVLKLMSMMNVPPPPCSNCLGTPCKSGTAVTSVHEVRAGTVLAPNPDTGSFAWWNMKDRGETVVKSIREGKMIVVEEGEGAVKYTTAGNYGYKVFYKGIPVFHFFCKK